MNCSICGVGATMSVGAEPRCPDHVDVRVSRLSRQVAEFHKAVDQPILPKPSVPDGKRIALRVHLILEEAFEFVEACGLHQFAQDLRRCSEQFYGRRDTIQPDLPAVADALADLDYVVEGTRLEFGINGGPIADVVHASNVLKASGPVREDGKRLKPSGFEPPDIAGELRKQGWEG